MSLQESFEAACTSTIHAFQQEVEDQARTGRFIAAVEAREWVTAASPMLGNGEALVRRLRRVASLAGKAPFALQYRLYRAISELCRLEGIAEDGETPLRTEVYDDLCFARINDEILTVARRDGLWPVAPPCMVVDEVSVSLPVRLNWGGGWSDTPPYCLEHGGTVLNAAIRLRGERLIASNMGGRCSTRRSGCAGSCRYG